MNATSLAEVQGLLDPGWSLIRFDTDDLCAKVISGWNTFLEKPMSYKKKWTIPSKDAEGPDNGYTFRNGKDNGKSRDLKEFFHYRPYLPALLEQQAVPIGEHREWLLNCDRLYRICRNKGIQITDGLHAYLPSAVPSSGLAEHPFAEFRHVLRLLSYSKPSTKGQMLGEFHTDRNFITLHLWENIPGLEFKARKTRHQYTVRPGQVLVFPGKKARRISKGQLRGLPHGIVGREDMTTSTKRQSIVFFSHIE
jgi:hypothetical protein